MLFLLNTDDINYANKTLSLCMYVCIYVRDICMYKYVCMYVTEEVEQAGGSFQRFSETTSCKSSLRLGHTYEYCLQCKFLLHT